MTSYTSFLSFWAQIAHPLITVFKTGKIKNFFFISTDIKVMQPLNFLAHWRKKTTTKMLSKNFSNNKPSNSIPLGNTKNSVFVVLVLGGLMLLLKAAFSVNKTNLTAFSEVTSLVVKTITNILRFWRNVSVPNYIKRQC